MNLKGVGSNGNTTVWMIINYSKTNTFILMMTMMTMMIFWMIGIDEMMHDSNFR